MDERFEKRRIVFEMRVPAYFGMAAAVIGILAFAGWAIDSTLLKSLSPDFATFKPNAAFAVVLLGISLAALSGGPAIFRKAVGRAAAGAAAAIGIATIIEHSTGVDLGIDRLFFDEKQSVEGLLPPGRMAFFSGVVIALLGISLLAIHTRKRAILLFGQIGVLATLFISLLTIIEYLYDLRAFERSPVLATIALNAAGAFLMISAGLLLAFGNCGPTSVFWSNHAGGYIARRAIPFIIFFPMIIGWFRLWLEQERLILPSFGVAVFAIANILGFAVIVWLLAISAGRIEARREQAEKRLDESLRELESIMGALNQAAIVAITDTDGNITYVNDRFTQISGYGRDEAIGQNHRIVNSSYHSNEFWRKMWETITAGLIFRGEIRNRSKDGRLYWVDSTIVPVLGDDGKPTRYIAIRYDITNRKLAEGKLVESEGRYRLLFENNPYPMWVYDVETLRFLAANDAAVEHYGYAKDEFLAMRITDIRPEEDIPTLLENVANTKTVIDNAGIWRHVRKDGSIILVEISSHELEFGQRRSRLVLAHDVTDRVEAERNLRNSEERYRALASSAQMVWLADPNGVLKKPAENWEEITGLKINESPDEWWLEGVHPGDREFTLRKWRDSMRSRKVYEIENRVKSAGGNYRYYYTRGVPVFDDDGNLREWVGMTIDINERKTAEAALLRLNETLEQRVAERTIELEAVNKELEAFSYSVSHDLRAPLRAMDGFSQVLIEDYADALDVKGADYLARVRAASQRMASLIDDLLMLSRISRRELKRESVDLSAIASEILHERQEAEPGRDVEIRIQEGVVSYCDENLARVALQNLLGNAWKFSSKRERSAIEFGADLSNGFREYFVRDNGAGFDMEYADKLFGAFQRLHSESEFEGTGIGLATVNRIVRLHGGSIRAEGRPGDGAAFYFTFETGNTEEGNVEKDDFAR